MRSCMSVYCLVEAVLMLYQLQSFWDVTSIRPERRGVDPNRMCECR